MSITQEQRELRRHYVGASDIPGLLGQCPFTTPHSIWLSKVHPEQVQREESLALSLGNRLEPVVLDLAQEKLEAPSLRRDVPVALPGTPLMANLDGLCTRYVHRKRRYRQLAPVEAKTCGFAGEPLEKWGRAGTDRVPLRVALQLMTQLHILHKRSRKHRPVRGFVALLSGHDARGFSLYCLNYDRQLGELIEKVACHFWHYYVQKQVEPDPDWTRIP